MAGDGQGLTDSTQTIRPPVFSEMRQTTCYMCACRCGINVHLTDGPEGKPQVAYIEGNPDHPVNRGVLCAKGSAGIKQHTSPARLRAPLRRTGPRGSGEFEEISWDEALDLATSWLRPIRETDPKRLAFFTGRDQSQSFTSFWAQMFGTPNYAAHGGFCSVNMAAAGIYTLGGAFWEFGQPDWERTELFVLFGVAEDHDSNPIKMGIGQIKGRGAKVIGINPVRTGYNAVADDWIGITPGTDGLLVLALVHELLKAGKVDLEYLAQWTDAPCLVGPDGLLLRDAQGKALVIDRATGRPAPFDAPGIQPDLAAEISAELTADLVARMQAGTGADAAATSSAGLSGDLAADLAADLAEGHAKGHAGGAAGEPAVYPASDAGTAPKGRPARARSVFRHLADRYLSPEHAPEAVADRCGIPAARIRALAAELADAAFGKAFTVDQPWTDFRGTAHAGFTARPVAMHAMRGVSAHANGFQTCRAIHLLQLLLGSVEAPGGFRFKPPYPKPVTAHPTPHGQNRPGRPLDGPHLGFPRGPEDLLLDAKGAAQRIDKAFTWENPLSVHGLMHMVIANAHAGDPYRIDTLFLYMANMAWNSSMNVASVTDKLTDMDQTGAYRIPHIIYSDAYSSEMVAYADLILPDTTYLERHDCISLLDRPICEADAAADAIRWPVVAPDRPGHAGVRGFQSVLVDLANRLDLPGFTENGQPLYTDYADYIERHERRPGIGPLMGWRGDGSLVGRGAPAPGQIQRYIANGGFFVHEIPEEARFMKPFNAAYQDWAVRLGLFDKPQPYLFSLWCEPLRRFQRAAEGHGPHQPPERLRARLRQVMDPLPIWYPPDGADPTTYPLHALTQRPAAMYHSWGAQNAWLRQIHGENPLYLPSDVWRAHGFAAGDWARLTSPHGAITVPVALQAALNPHTVWTWNAIGKRAGAWALDPKASEATRGFLLNHLIHELLPPKGDGLRWSNSDPITGQAAWFDLRVRIDKVPPPADGHACPKLPELASPVGRGGRT